MSLGLKVLPRILSQFALVHPTTTVAVDLSDRFVDIVEEDYDLAIRISGPPSDKSTIWRKICLVPRMLVASPDFLARNGAPERPEDLVGMECLSYHNKMQTEVWSLTRSGITRNIEAKGRFSVNNGDFLAELATAGEGVALLPHFIVEDGLKTGRLVTVLDQWSPPEIWLTLYYPPYEYLPLKVATFSDFFETNVLESWKMG